MSIKDSIDKILSSLPDEGMSEVRTMLNALSREAGDLLSDLSAANHESKTRKEKIRELTTQLEDLNDIKADFNLKIKEKDEKIKELKKIETLYKDMKSNIEKGNEKKWQEVFDTYLKVDESDARFDKISPLLKNFVIENPTPEQIESNLKMFSVLEPTGVFDSGETHGGVKPGGKRPLTANPFDKYPDGSLRDMNEAIRLSKEEPVKAEKLASEAREIEKE